MTPKNLYRYVAYSLIVLPLVTIIWKFNKNPISLSGLWPKEIYTLTYEFDLSNLWENAFIKAFLPQSNNRQLVSQPIYKGDTLAFETTLTPAGKIGVWTSEQEKEAVFQWAVEIESKKIAYDLSPDMGFETSFSEEIMPYLEASQHIQSKDSTIAAIAQQLKAGDFLTTMQNNFNFVQQITNSNTGVLTDALTTLRRNRASCNGKSRLFVALCRAQGIPAKVVGGIILENVSKRTSHLWANVYYQGYWIPYDSMFKFLIKKSS